MKNLSKNKTVAELQDEYSLKSQTERRKSFQEKYLCLSNLFTQIKQRNNYGYPIVSKPISKIKLTRLQQMCAAFLNLLLNRKKK